MKDKCIQFVVLSSLSPQTFVVCVSFMELFYAYYTTLFFQANWYLKNYEIMLEIKFDILLEGIINLSACYPSFLWRFWTLITCEMWL